MTFADDLPEARMGIIAIPQSGIKKPTSKYDQA